MYGQSENETEIETFTHEENETDPLQQLELETKEPIAGPAPLEYSRDQQDDLVQCREEPENHGTAETETEASSSNGEGTDSDTEQ